MKKISFRIKHEFPQSPVPEVCELKRRGYEFIRAGSGLHTYRKRIRSRYLYVQVRYSRENPCRMYWTTMWA